MNTFKRTVEIGMGVLVVVAIGFTIISTVVVIALHYGILQ